MKTLKYFMLFILANTFIISCSSDDDNISNSNNQNETDHLILIQTISNESHQLAIFSENGKLMEGYNSIYIQIKDNNNELISNANINWEPLMHMHNMSHSAPFSNIAKTYDSNTLYHGFIIFQMASNDDEYWALNFDYTIDGVSYQMSDTINVQQAERRRLVSFVGNDDNNYLIALVEPKDPKVAINDMVAAIYKMENMHQYSLINDYVLKIDPRMPGMGNHGSPNNQDLTQGADLFYHGKLSLTMTGYWKINLILENEIGETLKGESISDDNESSSIFFEIEF